MFVGWREGNFIAGVAAFEPADPDNYWQTARYSGFTKMQRCLTVTLPFMVEGFVQRDYACVYDYTPDGMPILDQADPVKGLYFSLGHSGGGFPQSPWVGRTMAHFVAHGAKPPELNLLRFSRFVENDLVTWSKVKKQEAA